MTEPATPAAEPSTDRLSSYYSSLFPGAGSPAIQEMVRLRRDHDRVCGDYFELYCAAMGVEPSTFSGTQSSDPVQDVTTERARLAAGLAKMTQLHDQKHRDWQLAEAQAVEWKTRLVEETERLRGILDETQRPGETVLAFLRWIRGSAFAVDLFRWDDEAELEKLVARFRSEHRASQPPLPDGENIDKLHDALYDAWGVIANAAGWPNGPTEPHPDWLPAAQRWRDRYHRLLGDYSELGRQERRRATEQRAQPEMLSESESHVRQLARRHTEWIEQHQPNGHAWGEPCKPDCSPANCAVQDV